MVYTVFFVFVQYYFKLTCKRHLHRPWTVPLDLAWQFIYLGLDVNFGALLRFRVFTHCCRRVEQEQKRAQYNNVNYCTLATKGMFEHSFSAFGCSDYLQKPDNNVQHTAHQNICSTSRAAIMSCGSRRWKGLKQIGMTLQMRGRQRSRQLQVCLRLRWDLRKYISLAQKTGPLTRLILY